MGTGNFSSASITFLAILLLAFTNLALADQKDAVCNALLNEQVAVLIINDLGNDESERYADWSYYLNDFSSSHADEYTFFHVDTESMARLIYESERFDEPYSLIFMKSGSPSLFHQRPILEPQAYEYVELFYAQQAIPAHLHQFAPVETDIRLKGCQ